MDLGVDFVDVDIKKLQKQQKKQKKKEKKEKKRLKKEASKKSDVKSAKGESSPSSQSSGSQGQLEQEAARQSQDPLHETLQEGGTEQASRDTWMTETAGRNILTGKMAEDTQDEPPEATKKEKEVTLKPGLQGENAITSKGKSIGDGGASWRLKALKRSEAQAAEEGRDLGSIVSERFRSLNALKGSLGAQRTAHPKAHLHASKDRLRQRDGGEAADYLLDLESQKMRKPNATSSLSWRKKGQEARPAGQLDSGAPGRGSRDQSGRSSPGRGSRDQSGWGSPERGSRGQPRRGSPERGSNSHRTGEHKQVSGSVREVTNARDRASEGSRKPVASVAGDRNARRDKGSSKTRAGEEDLNKFKNDGSFLEQFAEPQQALPRAVVTDEVSERQEQVANAYSERHHNDLQTQADPADGNNRSAAAALRSRLMGKSAGKLATITPATEQAPPSKRQVHVLPSVDAEGRAMPGAFGRSAVGEGQADGGRKPKKLQRYAEGEKQVYFADDDKHSLDDLVREQRHGGGNDMDANLAENISRKARFREKDLDVDEEYDVDGGLDMYESRNTKVTKEKAVKRQRTSQIADLRRTDRALDNCNLCFGSPRMKKHLNIALGQTTYLSIPERGRLAPLHCCIVPLEHVASSRKTDEHVWTEMRNFKKCILQMFMAEGFDTVFIETAMRLGDRRSHAIIHAVPLEASAFHRAPIVFKKSMMEAESEWSQHNAKAAIDTRVKGLRGSIPPNFPYFFVEFGLSAGYLHVIDAEEKFDRDFGRSILSGLLGLGAESQHRGARAEPEPVVKQLQSDFASKFDPYDWTKQLA